MPDIFRRWWRNNQHHFESVWEVIRAGYPARKLKVIGVTGTDGKTTTCHLIYEMFKAAGKRVALVSTVAAYIGDEEIDTGFHVTTPDAKFLQPLIKRIAEAGMEYLVLETTSHGLDQHRVLGCNYLVGVLTNITHEHLDYHKTMERYREAKAKLMLNVRYSILNRDDPSFGWFKERCRRGVIAYGKTDMRVGNPALAGDYNKYNIGAAEAVARIFRVQEYVPLVVRSFSGVPGRREEVELGQKFRAVVDFAHTPNALELLLKQLRKELPRRKRLILVFGCAGLRDYTKRPMMGRIAKKLADVVIVTAEDPRTETLESIYGEIAAIGSMREDDRQKAINMAVKMARPGDVVVVTGKGHEKSMCFGSQERPWSDVEAMKRAIHLLK